MMVPRSLKVRHDCAMAIFADMSCQPCIIGETVSGARTPTLLLGKHHHAMRLGPDDARALIPHLQTFACTGQLVRPLEEDFSI